MNFISPAQAQVLTGAEPILTIDLAHVWRSKIVDKCAEAERYILRLLAAGGETPPKAPLSQKMKCLSRLIIDGSCAIRTEKIGPLLARLEPLSNLRAELVHSTMSVAEIDGEWVAVLHNAAADTARTVLSAMRLKACHQELSKIANSLRQEAARDK